MEPLVPATHHYPDVEPMTAGQILRELEALKSLMAVRIDNVEHALESQHADLTRVPTDVDRQVDALKELVFVRLDDMDTAIGLARERADRIPEQRAEALAALREVFAENLKTIEVRFGSVQTEFILRDERVKQTATDTKVAVDAALQAAEKAVQKQNESFSLSIDKSEKATLEQIAQQRVLLQTATAALNDKIDDLKERMGRMEGMGLGTKESATTQHSANSFLLSLFVAGISLAGLIALLLRDFAR